MSTETTRISLVHSLLRLIRKKKLTDITIEEICENSNVSRRTFYRYYTDKYDLLRDVYLECFFSKIEIKENDDFWDIFVRICEQIYSDKQFFRHAIKVKEQNGFWEEASKILAPYYMREAPTYEYTEKMKVFFVETELDRLFRLIEKWIDDDMKDNADKFSSFIRTNYYIYGMWTAQLASKQKRMTFTKDIFDKFDQMLKDNEGK